MGTLAHNPGHVVHRGRHADKARAHVAQGQQQNAHPLVVLPHVFQVVFQLVMSLYRRAYTLANGIETEQKHTGTNQRQHGHCHLVAFGFVVTTKPVGHR